MRALFVTATGTDIGKTYLTCRLVEQAKGRLAALKPIMSGFDASDIKTSDSGQLLKSMGRAQTLEEVEKISPWRFAAALSPNMAAAREDRQLAIDEIVSFCHKASQECAPAIPLIESVGGVMVPLNASHTTLDWQVALGAPCLLIAGTYLGALSHSLTALTVLAHKGMRPIALLLNTSPDSPVSPDDMAQTIGQYHPDLPLFIIPRNKNHNTDIMPSALLDLIFAQFPAQ
ncbi:MAG: dethiobiotin synthase [Alphaproteobacteria bacterium]|nr:dethiobiotin synthase [Alphaproteobacteria bacterium]